MDGKSMLTVLDSGNLETIITKPMRTSTKVILLTLALFPIKSFAQCCGAGNPVSSIGNESAVRKGMLRTSLDYRHSESNKYYEGTHASDIDFPGKIQSSGYDYIALGIGYGITSRLSAQAKLGYFFDKYEKYSSDLFEDVSASGIGDLSISANYAVYRNVRKGITINPYLAVKFPVGKFDCVSDGVKLPISMQPSSGSYKYSVGMFATYSPIKGLNILTNIFWEYAQRIKTRYFDYKYGDLLYANVEGQYQLFHNIATGIVLAYEHKGRARSNGTPMFGTIYRQIKLSPLISCNPFQRFSISALIDIPLWRKAEGIQMVNSWAIEIKTTYNIKL